MVTQVDDSEPSPSDDVGTTKADEIRHQLEELILAEDIQPGTVLRQDELAERFGVSRTPIREALRQLGAIGLVTFVPNRGVRVRRPDRHEWHETYLARAALEGTAAEHAARTITQAELRILAEAEEDFVRQTDRIRRTDISPEERTAIAFEWVAANERFHDVVLHAAHLPVIERLVDDLRRVFSGAAGWSSGSAADELYDANIMQHAAIRAALLARNGQAARQLMETHIRDSWNLLVAVLDEASYPLGE